eukprot:TRINITY_DN15388_c0_g1_i1.p1 TRINITY_DN15388_c0_g1~~TRINITY_DN15388_c0_g1_i1.p1  ORF type:complete len:566 (-),score=96.80 TRINITY_DN15388_c0_g1_i1:127-1737(-)
MHKYEQVGIAGEGAYGVVLKCKHKESGEIVAIKKFREADEDEEAKRISQREVKIAKMLKQENIVEMREAFRTNGILHLVFEYVETCMMDLLEVNKNGVSADTTRTLTFQLTRALEHCHKHQVIHRDIKPENLLINPADNSLRLCDFGSACKLGTTAVLTDYVATRWYRAPELLVRFDNYTAGVDIWALGCVMVEMAVGQPLFTAQTDLEQLCIIHSALGPLTPEQSERSLELSEFGGVKFSHTGERQTLRGRFAHAMSEPQLDFLDGVIVVDPARRLSASAALATAWLQDARAPPRPQSSAAKPPRPVPEPGSTWSSRPPSRPTSQPPAPAQKPRVRREISPCAPAGQQANASAGYRGAPSMAPVGAAVASPRLPVAPSRPAAGREPSGAGRETRLVGLPVAPAVVANGGGGGRLQALDPQDSIGTLIAPEDGSSDSVKPPSDACEDSIPEDLEIEERLTVPAEDDVEESTAGAAVVVPAAAPRSSSKVPQNAVRVTGFGGPTPLRRPPSGKSPVAGVVVAGASQKQRSSLTPLDP